MGRFPLDRTYSRRPGLGGAADPRARLMARVLPGYAAGSPHARAGTFLVRNSNREVTVRMKIMSANGMRVLILLSLALGFFLGKRLGASKTTDAK